MKANISNDIEKIILTEEQIQKRICEIAKDFKKIYGDEEMVLICILKGSVMFTADLSRMLGDNVRLEFMQVSSYGDGTTSSGNINIIKDLNTSIEGKHAIILEDIIDTGNTLKALKAELLNRNPKSLKLCAFLDKPSRRTADIDADYVGFEVEDNFLVGYGLDYSQKYRNLPYIAILKREVYEK